MIEGLDAGLPRTVVVYGTSLTAGGAWVGQLSAGLNAKYPGLITRVNAGLSGKASNSGVESLSSQVLAHDPDAVFVEFAMNDAFTDYEPDNIDHNTTQQMSQSNLNAMIDAIRNARPDCEIVMQTMNPAWDAPNGNQSGTKRPELAANYAGYREVAAARGLPIVDNFAVWSLLQANESVRFESFVSDGTHPNAAGYQLVVTPAIRWTLGASDGLSLLVDPTSGRALLHNYTSAEIEFISDTISSSAGALRTSCDSIAGRGNPEWFTANPTNQNLSELRPTGSLPLAAQLAIDLGVAWNNAGALDLSFAYQTTDGVDHNGAVVYATAASALFAVAGDYNIDGVVDAADAADYTVWRDTLGSPVPNGAGADGNWDGVVDPVDYTIWNEGFGGGEESTAVAAAVPEPTGCLLAAETLLSELLTASCSAFACDSVWNCSTLSYVPCKVRRVSLD